MKVRYNTDEDQNSFGIGRLVGYSKGTHLFYIVFMRKNFAVNCQ